LAILIKIELERLSVTYSIISVERSILVVDKRASL